MDMPAARRPNSREFGYREFGDDRFGYHEFGDKRPEASHSSVISLS